MLGVDLVEVFVQGVVHPHKVPFEHQLLRESTIWIMRSWVSTDPQSVIPHVSS